MSSSRASRSADAEAYLGRRRARLERLLQRPLPLPAPTAVPADRRRFLREEAEELYWNELEWEKLTAEEMGGGSELVEHAFPGFLALIDGMLLREVRADSPAPAQPRPEVVEDVLVFLSGRCVELQTATEEVEVFEREVTTRLIDLVLYRLHEVPVEGGDWRERARLDGND